MELYWCVVGPCKADCNLLAGKYYDKVECCNLRVMSGPTRLVFLLTRSHSSNGGSNSTF